MNAQYNSDKRPEWQTPVVNSSEPLIIHIIDDEESVRTSCDFLISSLGAVSYTHLRAHET